MLLDEGGVLGGQGSQGLVAPIASVVDRNGVSFGGIMQEILDRMQAECAGMGAPRAALSYPALLGLVLLELLSVRLGLLSLFPDGSFLSLAVPVLVLAVHVSAPMAQVLLKSTDQVYRQPFIDVLRAKGAPPAWIFFRHVLKNAAGPALTILGITVGTLFAGSVITETVFARAGLGAVVLQAVTAQDVPLVQGLVLLTAVVFVTVNLAVDLIHPLLDPRILTAAGQGSPRALAA